METHLPGRMCRTWFDTDDRKLITVFTHLERIFSDESGKEFVLNTYTTLVAITEEIHLDSERGKY